MYHTLEPVNTGREAPHLLSMSEPTACKEASLFEGIVKLLTILPSL
jgi:hypothetical protein